MRVERSDLVLRVGVSCLKTACGDKLILPLFGGIDATRATVSVPLVRRNTVYHQEEVCPRLLALCESVYPNGILEWLERGVCVLVSVTSLCVELGEMTRQFPCSPSESSSLPSAYGYVALR